MDQQGASNGNCKGISRGTGIGHCSRHWRRRYSSGGEHMELAAAAVNIDAAQPWSVGLASLKSSKSVICKSEIVAVNSQYYFSFLF